MSTRAAIAAALVALLLPATAGAQRGVSVESGNGNDQATAVTPAFRPADRGNSTDTLLVLERLHSYGYSINTATRADRAIRHWEKANALVVDGIVGPRVMSSLGLSAVASAPAVREVQPSPPEPAVAPALDGCEEMSAYRIAAGLPAAFDALGWRESNCRNEDGVRTSCCVSWWQLWVSLHLRDGRIAPRYHDCGVYSEADVNSDTPEDKQRAACATKALYDVVGMSAWR